MFRHKTTKLNKSEQLELYDTINLIGTYHLTLIQSLILQDEVKLQIIRTESIKDKIYLTYSCLVWPRTKPKKLSGQSIEFKESINVEKVLNINI